MVKKFNNKSYYSIENLDSIIDVAVNFSDNNFIKHQINILNLYNSTVEIENISVFIKSLDAISENSQKNNLASAGNFRGPYMSGPVVSSSDTISSDCLNVSMRCFRYDAMEDRGWFSGDSHSSNSAECWGIKPQFCIENCMPGKKNEQFIFEYYAKVNEPIDCSKADRRLQYLSVPFYFAWLLRLGCIDRETLADWFQLLAGITPARLDLLREIVNIGRYQTEIIADRLEISDRVVRNYISEALHSISYLLPELESKTGNSSHCVDLVRYYWFLRYVGVSKKSTENKKKNVRTM